MTELYNAKERRLMVVKSLRKHKQLKGLSVMEIAEAKGIFPSDVELSFKELQQEGFAKCYIFKGKLYAILHIDPDTKFYDMPEDDGMERLPPGKHTHPSMFG
jgi:hypothetical protein